MKKTIEAAVLTLMLTGILAATTTPLKTKLAAGGPLPVPTTPVCMPDDQQCIDTANGTPTQPAPAPSFR